MLRAMALYRLERHVEVISPVLVAALDSWVDAGEAATTAAGQLAEDGQAVATFDADSIFDYRARRPTLEIPAARPAELTWPELTVRHARLGDRDVLVLSGPEPDYRWKEFATAAV